MVFAIIGRFYKGDKFVLEYNLFIAMHRHCPVQLKPFTSFYVIGTNAHEHYLHVTLYGSMKFKFHDAEAIIITLLILNFSHFKIYIFVHLSKYIKKTIPSQYGVTFKSNPTV